MKPATAYKDEEGCGRGSAAPLNLRFLVKHCLFAGLSLRCTL
jgi:hypothetical protein